MELQLRSFSLKTGHSDGRQMPSVLEKVLLKGAELLLLFKDHPCIRTLGRVGGFHSWNSAGPNPSWWLAAEGFVSHSHLEEVRSSSGYRLWRE